MSDFPRSPSAYTPSIHFGERFGDRYAEHNRHLDGEIIRGCIERGSATRTGPNTVKLHEEFGGVTYRLVLNVEDREVVTAHPTNIDLKAARESGRWTCEQIEDIHEFIVAKEE